jgi:hypothetical protein
MHYVPGVRSVERNMVSPEQWFTLDLIAIDNRLITMLNGETAQEIVDHGRMSMRGCFALQKYTPETLVKFRKIEVKKLP